MEILVFRGQEYCFPASDLWGRLDEYTKKYYRKVGVKCQTCKAWICLPSENNKLIMYNGKPICRDCRMHIRIGYSFADNESVCYNTDRLFSEWRVMYNYWWDTGEAECGKPYKIKKEEV